MLIIEKCKKGRTMKYTLVLLTLLTLGCKKQQQDAQGMRDYLVEHIERLETIEISESQKTNTGNCTQEQLDKVEFFSQECWHMINYKSATEVTEGYLHCFRAGIVAFCQTMKQ